MSDRNQVAELSAEVKRVTSQRDEYLTLAGKLQAERDEARALAALFAANMIGDEATIGEAKQMAATLLSERDALRDAAMLARNTIASIEWICDEEGCAWCGYDIFHKHSRTCPRQLALAALDAALEVKT